jgi:hypothetical protein
VTPEAPTSESDRKKQRDIPSRTIMVSDFCCGMLQMLGMLDSGILEINKRGKVASCTWSGDLKRRKRSRGISKSMQQGQVPGPPSAVMLIG